MSWQVERLDPPAMNRTRDDQVLHLGEQRWSNAESDEESERDDSRSMTCGSGPANTINPSMPTEIHDDDPAWRDAVRPLPWLVLFVVHLVAAILVLMVLGMG
jgi:hypothetical protein